MGMKTLEKFGQAENNMEVMNITLRSWEELYKLRVTMWFTVAD
jgi:hypothetical protein